MTTGNRNVDLRVPVSTTTGTARIGKLEHKDWSGGDKAVVKPPRTSVGRLTVSYDKFGHKVYHWGHYRPPTRLPKRAYNEVHPYSCNWRIENDVFLSYSNDDSRTPWLDVSGTGSVNTIAAGVQSATPFNLWSSNDDLRLLGKLREKVAGSDFNAGVFLGEGRQALKMIATNATKIYKALIAVRKGRVGDAAHILTGSKYESNRNRFKSGVDGKTVANNWLELQYGWLPLLSDVRGGAEFLSHHLTVPMVFRVVVQSLPIERRGLILSNSPTAYFYPHNVSRSYGRVLALLKEKDVVGLSGLMDPLSVAWELLPYSFVIDWFIPIGNYLQARGLSQALTGTFVTTKKNTAEIKNLGAFPIPPYVTRSVTPVGEYWMRHTTVNRTVSTTLPVPLPSFKPLSKVASWRHAANAVALLTQLKK